MWTRLCSVSSRALLGHPRALFSGLSLREEDEVPGKQVERACLEPCLAGLVVAVDRLEFLQVERGQGCRFVSLRRNNPI